MRTTNLLRLTLALVLQLVSWTALAVQPSGDFGLEVGFRQQSGDTDTSGVSTQSQVGYNLGLTAAFNISGPLFFRTGLMYSQRPLLLSLNALPSDQAKITMTYFDVPATVLYKFEDYAGVYGGLIVGLNLDKSYSGTGSFSGASVTGAKSSITPLVIGAVFKFAPQMGANVYFETGGDVATSLKSYRSVGAHFVFTFD